MRLSLQNVHRRFGTLDVLQGLSLDVDSGELVCLLGPSGCGKTTLLRLVAGLDAPDGGRVMLGGDDLATVPVAGRPVAMVFQQPSLWPARTVAANVAYGLEIRGVPEPERRRRVDEVLALVRLEGLENRYPGEISGGQQQRVALARALAVRPGVLLLDEPFSHLDVTLRRELRREIRRIHRATGLTILHVTHDPMEALSLGDRIGVLRDGVMAQVAPPREIHRHPISRAVAESFGEIQWLEGRVVAGDADGVDLVTALGGFRVEPRGTTSLSGQGWLGFRPGVLRVDSSSINTFPATVREVVFMGGAEEWTVEIDGGILWRAEMRVGTAAIAPGAVVQLSAAPSDLVWVSRE